MVSVHNKRLPKNLPFKYDDENDDSNDDESEHSYHRTSQDSDITIFFIWSLNLFEQSMYDKLHICRYLIFNLINRAYVCRYKIVDFYIRRNNQFAFLKNICNNTKTISHTSALFWIAYACNVDQKILTLKVRILSCKKCNIKPPLIYLRTCSRDDVTCTITRRTQWLTGLVTIITIGTPIAIYKEEKQLSLKAK